MPDPVHTPRQLKGVPPTEIERRIAALVDALIGAEPGTTEATIIRMDFAPPGAPAVSALRGVTDLYVRLHQSASDDDVSWLHGGKPPES